MATETTVALVGSESLLGREIRDVAATSSTGLTLRLIAADKKKKPGKLTRVADEPALAGELDAATLAGARAVLLAGSAESSHRTLELLAAQPGTAVIDPTWAAEVGPDSRLRAPAVEQQAGKTNPYEGEAAIHVIAHPAAIALALLLRRLHVNNPIRRSVVQVFAPASEHGAAGIEELQAQTVSMLSFKNMPRAIFDAQLAFGMLAQYGAEAPAPLEQTELRIEHHLATLLALPGEGEGTPMPSLRVVQAPVFHGYSASVWVEFEGNPGVEAIESSLATGSIDVRGAEFEPPNNVGQAGQGGIAVGAIAPDRNNAKACWLWLVADNLRVTAENAVAVAREMA